MKHNLDGLAGAGQPDAHIDFAERQDVRDELLCREFRRRGQGKGSAGLIIGCAEMSLDSDVVVVDQIAVQFGHRVLGHTAEEHNQAALLHHVNALGLGGVDRSGGDDLIRAPAAGQTADCLDGIFVGQSSDVVFRCYLKFFR